MKKTVNLDDLYNDYLLEIDIKVDRIKHLLDIILESYLQKSSIKDDDSACYEFVRVYPKIQSLIYMTFDMAYEAEKIIAEMNEFNVRDIILNSLNIKGGNRR